MGDFIAANATVVTAAATAVMAAMAIVTGVLTFVLARENRMLRRAGTEPEVAAYLAIDERHTECINLILKNLGQGPARNVRVSFDADQDDLASHKAKLCTELADVPITLLPQGERVVTFLGVGFQLLGDQPLRPIDVTTDYEDLTGRSHRRNQRLDVRQFEGLVTLGQPAEHEVAKALTSISENLKHIVQGNMFRLKVETVTRDEVRQEQERFVQRAREKRERRKDADDANDPGGSDSK